MTVTQLLFFAWASFVVIAAGIVIFAQPVRAVLSLVLTFFASSILWLLLGAEFLGLILIFVYIGAVMTLFLFVVMMLNVELTRVREKFKRSMWGIILCGVGLIGSMVFILLHRNPPIAYLPSAEDNVTQVGERLFTAHLYSFEILSFILLVAIVAAIALVQSGRKNVKPKVAALQLQASKADRLKILKMERH